MDGRIREEYAGDDKHLYEDATRQDSIVLNLQRACQSAIDLAMHLVQVHRLGIPQESRDAFTLLVQEPGDKLATMPDFGPSSAVARACLFPLCKANDGPIVEDVGSYRSRIHDGTG